MPSPESATGVGDDVPVPPVLNLRVAKGLGPKGYEKVRISLISKEPKPFKVLSNINMQKAPYYSWEYDF